MKHKGFTIVELLIVIVVIAILASITIVSYSFMRGDSVDAKIKTIVKTAGDAIQLQESQNGGRISGTGYFSVANGVDTLIPRYLKTGYRDGITSTNSSNADQVFRWYPCNDGGGGIVIYASLNNPTADDTATFNKLRNACHPAATFNQSAYAPTPQYNYAQVF